MNNEMNEKKNRNHIDQLIRMDLREAQNWIGCGAIISMFSAIIGMAAKLGLFRKLFYTCVFGEGDALYESLPVSPRELAVSKICVATAGVTIMNLVLVIASFLARQLSAGGATIRQNLLALIKTMTPSSLATAEIPAYVALSTFELIITALNLSVIVFAGIVWYCTREESKKGLPVKIADASVVIGLLMITDLPGEIRVLENMNAFLPTILSMVMKLILTVLLIPWILKKIDGRHERADRRDHA